MRFFRPVTVDGLLTASGGLAVTGATTLGSTTTQDVTATTVTASTSVTTPFVNTGNGVGSPGSVNKINLYGNVYGLGISSGSLDLVTGGSFNFYYGATKTCSLDFAGNLTLAASLTATNSTIAQADARLFVRNVNDTLRRTFIGDCGYAGFLGINNLTASVQGRMPANGDTMVLAWDANGKIGSVTNTGWSQGPAYRNVLDDGSGNAVISGYLTANGGAINGPGASAGNGYASLNAGSTGDYAGHLDLVRSDGTRAGYVGWNDGNKRLVLQSDTGYGWHVTGTSLQVDPVATFATDVNVGGNISARTGSQHYFSAIDMSNRISMYDSGGRYQWAGMTTEAQAQVIDYGINDGRFGGYNSGYQGGYFRVDSRSGPALFQFLGQGPGGTQSQIASIDAGGSFNGNTYYGRANGAQFMAPGYMHYSDGTNYYLLLTGLSTPSPSYNGLRPFYITLSTGRVGMGNGCDVGTGLTAPTMPAGDNSGNVATTAYVMGSSSMGSSGYVKLPNGFIYQWAILTGDGNGISNWTFPVAFPNACTGFFGSVIYTLPGITAQPSGQPSKSGGQMRTYVGGGNAGSVTVYVHATGY